ncbi:MAG: hypothetical protein IJ686_04875 [Bacteroidales bacterium]|nr:hypothetical protein [Bacteroidales bacterium]
MSRYETNLRKLGLLLLPTFLRRPLAAALLYSLLAPLRYLHVRLMHLRNETDYRIRHTGQVCYLRAVLNDEFDTGGRRITVTDYESVEVGGNFVHLREDDEEVEIYTRSELSPLTINRRGYVGVSDVDFSVNIPEGLRGEIDEARLRGVVNKYKLVSKRYTINYV